MKKEKKDKHFIKKPYYPGGLEAMKAFIATVLSYPPEAQKHQIEGVVLVKYTVNQLGAVVQAKVIHRLGYGCDEEAERIVRLLQFKVPKNRAKKLLFHKSINIHFKLNAVPTLQYVYTSSENENSTDTGGYNYVVNL